MTTFTSTTDQVQSLYVGYFGRAGDPAGANSWIGAGAVIRPRVRIGRNAIVGIGAAVVTDIPDGAVAVAARQITRGSVCNEASSPVLTWTPESSVWAAR